jgi:hypothetical protein
LLDATVAAQDVVADLDVQIAPCDFVHATIRMSDFDLVLVCDKVHNGHLAKGECQ